ncbi:MAG: hypothetical protein ACRDPA_04535 [Solirubrobacteraceae bacterium]
MSILDYRPDLGVDYLAVADELLRRLGIQKGRRTLRVMRAEAAPTPASAPDS